MKGGGTRGIGTRGEKAAVFYLQREGFIILEQNFYTHFGEIDIIARKNGELFFIEVKTRLNSNDGERAVDYHKRYHIFRSAQFYCLRYNVNVIKTPIHFWLMHIRPEENGFSLRIRDIPMDKISNF